MREKGENSLFCGNKNLHGSKQPVERAKDNLDCGIGFGFEQSNFGLATQFKCPPKINLYVFKSGRCEMIL